MNRQENRKTGEELQGYLAFKKRGHVVPAKRGKGSFKRKSKHSPVYNYD